MGKRFKLADLEAQHGDLHQVIPALVNQGGQGLAAHQLGVSQATISNWLKDNGYEVEIVWKLTAEAQAALSATRQNQPIRHMRETEAVL